MVGVGPATAAPSFVVTVEDLQFILQQIKISEAHATTEGPGGLGSVTPPTSLIGPGPLDIPDPELPWGLRQVDGRNNNLSTGESVWTGSDYPSAPGRSAWGSTDSAFQRLTDPVWRAGDPATVFGPMAPSYDPAERPSNVQDAQPRIISNLISDQSPNNPAAVTTAGPGATPTVDGSFEILNVSPDAGVAAPYNGMFALFGQFFDHGLDLVGKSGTESVIIPLQPDDPLYNPASPTNFMVLNRTILGAGGAGDNSTTPWVDQNQTYSSHPSKQVFMREYEVLGGVPVSTGQLLHGAIAGNLANWEETKAQAATMLGIELVDSDIFSVPLMLTDEYGRFLRGPNGLPQMVLTGGGVVEGDLTTPVSTAGVVGTGHAFLDDIAHNAVPSSGKTPDVDTDVNDPTVPRPAGTYDDELLASHFITGDGRGNENIGLTAIHTVFHGEHNRLVTDIQDVITTAPGGSFAADDWFLAGGPDWNGERLFQAARFITEMEYQHIAFEEFARKVQPFIRPFAAYDQTLQPDITAEFAHAVYRFGHSMLNATVDRTAANGSDLSVPLLDAFLYPPAFNDGGGAGQLTGGQAAGSVVRGMTNQIGNEIDEFVTDTLRNNLLGLPLDLPTLNMARARDAGTDSLNGVRRSLFNSTGNVSLTPYASWFDYGFGLRHPASLTNFIAAYGTHPEITGTVDERRVAAYKIVNGAGPGADFNDTGDDVPLAGDDIAAFSDRAEFLTGSGAWVNVGGLSVTGLEDVDLWVGGLAEARNDFGGMLGNTFDFVFRRQLEQLQEGDRFYYLHRLEGLSLNAEVETNTFSEMIMRNTDVTGLPFDAFSWPAITFNMDQPVPTLTAGQGTITVLADGTWRYGGDGHVVFNGTAGGDRMQSDRGDDTLRGNDGNDWMQSGAGDDSVVGGLGDDILLDTGGADTFAGGEGNDYMSSGGPGADLFNGGGGHDLMVGGVDANTFLAGPGNDLIFAGEAADAVSGGDQDDWIEGGTGSDGLTGDNGAEAGIDIGSPGDDVLMGQGGDDVLDGNGGLDIAVGGPGVDTFVGGFGFDWQTYYDPTNPAPTPANADLTIFAPAAGDILAGLLDAFLDVEALSGGDLDDTLRGDDRTDLVSVLVPGFTDELLDVDIPKIRGLQDLLGVGVTGWANGNILLGGAGSDLIEGRGGDDFIHGDAALQVQLSVPAASGVTGPADPADGSRVLVDSVLALRSAVLDRLLSPADVQIVRTVLPGGHAGENDVALFTGNKADYTVTPASAGRLTVTDNVPGRNGTNTLVGIETLRFADGDVSAPAGPSIPVNLSGTVTAGGGPLEGVTVWAYNTLTGVWTSAAPTDVNGAYTVGVPQGSYKVYVDPEAQGYPGRWIGGSGTLGDATILNLNLDTTQDVVLSVALSGTVTAAGAPVQGALVWGYNTVTGVWTPAAVTDAGGLYSIAAVPGPHKVYVNAEAQGVPPARWVGTGGTFAGATVVDLSVSAVQDIVLSVGLTGTVTAGGAPVVGALVWAYNTGSDVWSAAGVTDANGEYAVSAAPGPHKVYINPEAQGFAGRWVGGTGSFSSATVLDLNGATVQDIVLTVVLSGTVTAGGIPVVGAQVWAFNTSTGIWTAAGLTDANGEYSVSAAPGPHKVYVNAESAGHPARWVGGTGTFGGATVLDLTGPLVQNITL